MAPNSVAVKMCSAAALLLITCREVAILGEAVMSDPDGGRSLDVYGTAEYAASRSVIPAENRILRHETCKV